MMKSRSQVMRLLLGCTERTGDTCNFTTTDRGVELTDRGHWVHGVVFCAI